jgi:hypothetical protein
MRDTLFIVRGLEGCADAGQGPSGHRGFVRSHVRVRELVARVPCESGHVGEAHERGLLAASKFGDLAIDKVGR